jgi:hypothetical protein
MKNLLILSLLLSVTCVFAQDEYSLSKSVYIDVPFSSQFLEDGALIRNVNYAAVKKLIAQIESSKNQQSILNGRKLETRYESHITTITPPEAAGWFTKDKKGINYLISKAELHHKYFPLLQKTKFKAVCIGRVQDDKTGNIVYYIVVDSPELLQVRQDIQIELERRAEFTGKKTGFDANKFWPHITIGYIGGDVHSKPKNIETCKDGGSIVLF